MRSPSIKKLIATFPVLADKVILGSRSLGDDKDRETTKAGLIKLLCAKVDNPEGLEDLVNHVRDLGSAWKYVRSLCNSPYTSALWRRTVVLYAIDTLLDGYGIEPLGPRENHGPYRPPYEYVNMGDPYTVTLIYKTDTDNLFIGCWGDIAERHPNG